MSAGPTAGSVVSQPLGKHGPPHQLRVPPQCKTVPPNSKRPNPKSAVRVHAASCAHLGLEKEEEGGVVIANRSLLQQMLVEADDTDGLDVDGDPHADSDDKEDFSMSSRLVLGTPKAGMLKLGVPTLKSPTSNSSRMGGSHGFVPATAASVPRLVCCGSQMSASMSAVSAARPSTPGSAADVVRTGPPRPAQSSSVRPGSRGSGLSNVAAPDRRASAKRAVPATYAARHAQLALARAGNGAKPANRPRCGPQAFEMLREMDTARSNTPASATGSGEVVERADHEQLDVESTPCVSEEPPSDDEQLRAALGKDDCVGDSALPQGLPQESAADFVQRMKREHGIPSPPAPQVDTGGYPVPVCADTVLPVKTRTAHVAPPRSRSLDNVSRPAQQSARNQRARSQGTKVPPSREVPQHVESDESDSDEAVRFGPGGQPWKADVRSTVRNTATDERKTVPTRGSTGESVSSRMPPRPPKAPAQAAREAGSGRRRPEDVQAGKQLFFSKKPRDVDYTPATVEEYRQKFSNKDYSLGSLGPDLDDEGLLMKKAMQEKVKQFSKELHRVNKSRSEAVKEQPPKAEPKADPKMNARLKALEFAKKIPKPKLEPRLLYDRGGKRASQGAERVPEEVVWEDAARENEDIRRRQRQHEEDKRKVANIKRFLEEM